MEDPMQTVETLGPVAVMLHLRDSVVYETRNGIAVQWVPLGEGVVDFKAIIAKAQETLPAGRGVHEADHGASAGDSAGVGRGVHAEVPGRAGARFRALPGAGQKGHPYERTW